MCSAVVTASFWAQICLLAFIDVNVLQSAREGQRNLRKVHTIIRGVLQKLRQVDAESLGNTIAGQLLRLRDPSTGELLSDEMVMPEIGTMFLAGFETSGHTEAFAL